jgi:hypothetical protein
MTLPRRTALAALPPTVRSTSTPLSERKSALRFHSARNETPGSGEPISRYQRGGVLAATSPDRMRRVVPSRATTTASGCATVGCATVSG